MIDFTEILDDGETWELFARDFLQELGFFIEMSPDRGADGGKDLLITEDLKGQIGNYKLRWLVSCKHFARSNKSVQEKDELNIQERVSDFRADGFIGFYSTIPSTGLNSRLKGLRESGKIKDYKIFDHKVIESHLIRIGFADILMRYFPNSYRSIRPLHVLLGNYIALPCASCGKDTLESLYDTSYGSLFAWANKYRDGVLYIEDVYWACKGDCDDEIREQYRINSKLSTRWEDMRDLTIPFLFMRFLLGEMKSLKEGKVIYTDEAFEKTQKFVLAMSQKVVRATTGNELQRAEDRIELSQFF